MSKKYSLRLNIIASIILIVLILGILTVAFCKTSYGLIMIALGFLGITLFNYFVDRNPRNI